MFVEVFLFAILVQVIGLVSMSIVTGHPLNKTFKDTNMMAVFFCTGVILALLAVVSVDATAVRTAVRNNSGCSRGCGCGCDACRTKF